MIINPITIIIPTEIIAQPYAALPIISYDNITTPQINGPIAADSPPLNLERPKNSPNFSLGASSVIMIRCPTHVPPKAGPAITPMIILNINGIFAPTSMDVVVNINATPIVKAIPHKAPTR